MSDSYLPDNEPRYILSSLEELSAKKLPHAPTFRKVADEITRLRAENESMRQSLPLWAHKQMAANNELIERLRAERDALLARLAPVEDEALVEIAAREIFIERRSLAAAIAAVRPHIEAAERERCVKAVEKVAGRINVPLHERPAYEDGYLQGVHDAAAAIRRGK